MFLLKKFNSATLFLSFFLFSHSRIITVYKSVEDFLESLRLEKSSTDYMNKELGGFLGGIAGDNIGMPYEFLFKNNREDLVISDLLPDQFVHDPETNGGVFAQECCAGVFSDDTSMGLCFGKAIVDYKSYLNQRQIANYFCRWLESTQKNNFYSALKLDGNIFSDCGVTIRAVLNRYLESGRLESEEVRMTNGCLMRNYPSIIGSSTIEEAIYLSRLQTSVTHSNPSILNMSSLLTAVCWNLLKYDIAVSKDVIVDIVLNDKSGDPLIESYVKPMVLFFQKIGFDNLESLRLVERTDSLAMEIFGKQSWPEFFGDEMSKFHGKYLISSAGCCGSTFISAVWSVLATRSLNDALFLAASLGDDADTVASIAGNIAGTIYGAVELGLLLTDRGSSWFNVLQFQDKILDLYLQLINKKDVVIEIEPSTADTFSSDSLYSEESEEESGFGRQQSSWHN